MNRTAERTLAILQLIANSEQGITLQEIANKMGMAKSSAFVIVHTLLELNYIKTVENNDKKYRLGIETFSLGMKYVNDLNLVKQCENFLPAIAEKYNKTAFMAVLNGSKVVYLYKYVAQNARLATCELGSSKDAYVTALGKAILAFLSEQEQRNVLENTEFKQLTEYTITSPELLLQELSAIRQRGYSTEERELELITSCYGAPVFDYSGKVVAAISLSDFYNPEQDSAALVEDLVKVAGEISRNLGYIPLPGKK